MRAVEIYLIDNSELAEFEAIQKGYRLDVYVKVHDDGELISDLIKKKRM